MESVLTFICVNSHYAYFILCGCILLSGLCIPISEDVVLLISGGFASRCMPDEVYALYIWIFFACWISAWEAYWIGRLLGPRLFNIRWFQRIVTAKRLDDLKSYYERFGIFTFLVGRFIPGGVRNAIFLSSGLTQIPFLKFVLQDGVACLLASATIFSIGYLSGEHLEAIMSFVSHLEHAAIAIIAIILLVGGYMIYRRHEHNN